MNQMPGNFGREFSSKENRKAVLNPLPDCVEKEKFSKVLDLWEIMCGIHSKTMPTPDEGSQYGTLATELEKVLSSMKWIKRWPNQLIRVCHHNSVFIPQ